MDSRISANVAIYAGGHIVGGAVQFVLETTKGYTTVVNVPSRFGNAARYSLEMVCLGPAGPAGWLAFSVQLTNEDGESLGQPGIPALLWTRPWDVPMVTHLPQTNPSMPVHTVALSVIYAYGKPPRLGPDLEALRIDGNGGGDEQ